MYEHTTPITSCQPTNYNTTPYSATVVLLEANYNSMLLSLDARSNSSAPTVSKEYMYQLFIEYHHFLDMLEGITIYPSDHM